MLHKPHLVVIIGFVTLALLAGVASVLVAPSLVLWGLGGVIVLFCMVLFDSAKMLLVTVILSTAVDYNFWLEYRIKFGEFPVSIPDAVAVAYGIGIFAVLRLKRTRPISAGGVIGLCLTIWFLYNSTVSLFEGILASNPVYAILAESRLVFYAALAYFATLLVFRPERHLPIVMLAQIAAGLLVSIWQFGITLLGRGQEPSQIVFETQFGIARLLRDVGLPGTFAGTALVVLIIIQMMAPSVLGKLRRWAWGLVPLFVVASVFSMTRTIWVSMALSIGLLLLFFVIAGRKAIRLSRLIILVAVFLVVIALVLMMGRILLTEVYQAIEQAWLLSFSYQDFSLVERWEQTREVWKSLGEDGWAFWTGLGFGNIGSGADKFRPFAGIHNAYMWYMVIGGLPGLLLFLALWMSPLIVYIRLLDRSLDAVAHAYVVASIINWVTVSVVMLVSPALWTNAALFGMILGIASVLGKTYAARNWLGRRRRGTICNARLQQK